MPSGNRFYPGIAFISCMKSFLKKIQNFYFGYLFIALLPLSVLAFWKTYFSDLLKNGKSFDFYFHFHVIIAVTWLLMLIIQPVLFRLKKLRLHKLLGKISYILFPILLVSIVLLAHYRYRTLKDAEPLQLLIPFKDIIIALYGFLIAVYYRKRVFIHARGMLLTGIVFLEPVFVRIFSNYIASWPYAMYLSMICIYTVLMLIIIGERHTKEGKWVFPPVFIFYIVVHLVILNHWQISFLRSFATWFSQLNLT